MMIERRALDAISEVGAMGYRVLVIWPREARGLRERELNGEGLGRAVARISDLRFRISD